MFRRCMCRHSIGANGYVYETFGISKRFPVKLQLLLIRAEMPDNPLTAKCFIYDVELNLTSVRWFFRPPKTSTFEACFI